MKCDECSNLSVDNGILKIEGFGNLWTDKIAYDVTGNKKVVIETRVRLHMKSGKSTERKSEFIIGFSMNLSAWGSNTEDALTFRIGCDKEGVLLTAVRSEMYENFIETSKYILPPAKWQTIKITLTSNQLIAYVENIKVISADLSKTKFPQVGHVGLLSYYTKSTEIEHLNIYPK